MWKPVQQMQTWYRCIRAGVDGLQAYLITVGVISAQKKMLSVLTA